MGGGGSSFIAICWNLANNIVPARLEKELIVRNVWKVLWSFFTGNVGFRSVGKVGMMPTERARGRYTHSQG